MNPDQIIILITDDLKLSVEEIKEFKELFGKLLISNLLLGLPEKLQPLVKSVQNVDVQSATALLIKSGVTPEEANQLLDSSVYKSIIEIVEKYSDLLSQDTKRKLQDYLT